MEIETPRAPQAPKSAKPMLVKDVLQKTTLFFREKGIEPARLDTELLLAHGLGWERMKLYLNYEYPMTPEELSKCRELVRRRSLGEATAYILGYKDFYKHTFKVTSDVLIPRPETESLVEEAIEWGKKQNAETLSVVDLGTGSGCVGISVIAELPNAELVSADLSPKALAVARENAEGAGVSERARFVEQDAATFEFSGADMVLANPPYIAENDPEVQDNVKKFEPHMALFSAEDGFAHIRAWAKTAARIARPGAFVMFEIGHEQGAKAKSIFEETESFDDVKIVKDLAGLERFVRCYARGEKTNG